MYQELLRYAAYGTMTVTIFIISMMFADACMDTFRQWKQKTCTGDSFHAILTRRDQRQNTRNGRKEDRDGSKPHIIGGR